MKTSKFFKNILIDMALLLTGSLLFALSFPGFHSRWGWAPMAYIALVPIFLLIRRIGFVKSIIYGALYGYITYMVFNFWLAEFNPVAFLVVPIIYTGYFLLVFPLMKAADKLFPGYGWMAKVLVFMAYEVLRTKGFVGYSYGILGYSQYLYPWLIGTADLFGVMFTSLLVLLPSAIISQLIWDYSQKEYKLKDLVLRKSFIISVSVFIGLFLFSTIYSLSSKVNYDKSPRFRIALIQHNVNAWMSGIDVYRQSYGELEELSRQAEQEDPQLIVWSETSFVPAIEWHLKYRFERGKVNLIRELLDYLDTTETPYLIGNNDSFKKDGERISYNAALLFKGDDIQDRYHKIHLVPFTEHFPYKKYFPWLYDYIMKQGPSYYEKGDKYTVFQVDDTRFSSMICYEDTFGYLSRNFVKEGAEFLINITNDAWSPAEACSFQHNTMAVFRSIENRRSMARSTTGGLTNVIDPNGKILSYLEPFTKDILVYDIPVFTDRHTLFTRWGNWFEYLILILTAVMFAVGISGSIIRRRRSDD